MKKIKIERTKKEEKNRQKGAERKNSEFLPRKKGQGARKIDKRGETEKKRKLIEGEIDGCDNTRLFVQKNSREKLNLAGKRKKVTGCD